ncbi:PrgI family protein [Candidatus Uhrbacteria bacterium]|nr:PrgI family protein [Candidatus Uhrbacteria bacterium]
MSCGDPRHFILYRVFPLVQFIFGAVIVAAVAGTFAFLKINGQPFHLFFVNFVQTRTRPKKRVWNKEKDTAELKALIVKPPEVAKIVMATKSRPESSRLRDLALTVNTGGVYNPEEDNAP